MTITKAQLNNLEQAADKVFGKLGLDIEFTRHFLDRANDERNSKPITIKELAELFVKEYRRWGNKIAKMDFDAEAVMKDLTSQINIPFVINPDGNGKDLVAKTVMRKKNFTSPDPTLPVESVTESRDLWYLLVDGDEYNEWGTGSVIGTKNEMGKFAKKIRREYRKENGRDPDIMFVRAEPKRIKKLRPHKSVNEEGHDKNLYYVQPDGEWKKGGDGRSKGRKRKNIPKGAKIVERKVKEDSVCWDGYEKVPGKKDYEKGSCRKKNKNENSYPKPISGRDITDSVTQANVKVLGQSVKEEKHGAKKGTQAKGKSPTPKKSRPTAGSETPHPMRGKLVGENAKLTERWKHNIWGGETADGVKFKVDKLQGKNPRYLVRYNNDDKAEFDNLMVYYDDFDTVMDIVNQNFDAAVAGGEKFRRTGRTAHKGSYEFIKPVRESLTLEEQCLLQKGAWEVEQIRNSVTEAIRDPRELILQKALEYLDKMVASRGSKQDVGGYAFDIARSFDLRDIATAKELADMYHEWKGIKPHALR